ncbi:class I SAM-dependent methyltransferase [Cochlodiniinecator piscidefendens]|uniref:class I SAM-dependent methyltransferase n=1 Tax=Cochlodiniinecator piscidefendens TaxID=2715756 RepID=UPI00140BCAEE|nr:class I SAM-dependent methyltransferase [Cochlodiniinecator piscidefendens]
MAPKTLVGYDRFDLLKLLEGQSNLTGIELGVAAGDYSARMVESGLFDQFFGVDMYGDTHDTEQYKIALQKVGLFKSYKLLRMSFDEALDLFPNETFDFMYLDGYAGTGLEGGRTIRSWASKVKIGGLLAGDDYHEECPLLQSVVNELVEQNGFELMVTEGAFDNSAYGNYPSWAVVKTQEIVGQTSDELLLKGAQSSEKMRKKKRKAKKLDDVLKQVVSEGQYDKLREWNRKRKKARQLRKKQL